MNGKRTTGAIIGIFGGVVLVLGSLLTWGTGSLNVQALASAVGLDPTAVSAAVGDVSRSLSGIDVTGGKWALAMGIVAIVLGVLGLMRISTKAVAIGLIVAGLVGGGWALYDTTQADAVKEQAIEGAVPQLGANEGASALIGQYIDTSFGPGIWIAVVGGLIAIVGGVMVLVAGDEEVTAPTAAGMEPGVTIGSQMGAVPGTETSQPAPTPVPPMTPERPAMPPAEPSPPPPGGEESSPNDGGAGGTPGAG
jgi:hypothetical protein